MKFATKIFIYIFLAAALIIGGMSLITYFWVTNHHMQENIGHEKELATLVALKSEDYILRSDRIELYQFYRSILKVDPFVEYIFAEKQAEILVHTFVKGVPRGLLRLGPMDDPSKLDITPIEDNQGNVIYHLRIRIGTPEYATLHFGISDQKISDELIPYRNLMLLAGFLLLAIVPFSLALFLSRLVSKPLYVLRDGVKRIGSGELDYRLDLSTGDEMEQLVNDINTMAEKIERLRDGLEGEIGERRQAEGDLAKQTELLDHILNHVPHNVFWKDRQSVYLGCNKAFAEAAGLEYPENIIGKTDYDLPWRKIEADSFRQRDKKVIDAGEPIYDVEELLTQADRQEKTLITSKVPLKDSDGNVSGILGISYDITERKRMEEALKQTQKMEAIGTLAGGIAHDFNNILGSIIGYTELAMIDADRDSPGYSDLQQVLNAASRAKDLVRQILTFSRKSQEERRPIHLSAIVKEEAKLLRATLPTTIEIRHKIDDQFGMVNADLTQMHQIVMNLCTNAADAMHESGGVLEIAVSPIVITHESIKKHPDISPGPFVELKISDTGTGIDPSIVHRIFEPFFTTKEKERGTGMGLAVVHGIVKDHGGDILVESHPGRGTTFTVLLPRVISADSDRQDDSALAAPTGCERILFVDDEKMLLNLGGKTLGALGYKVTTLHGSLEALEAFQQAPDFFDIVITDQTMPHMTGYNLAKRILEIRPSARVILCTGYSDAITPEKAQAAGIKALLYKPISKTEFARSIREALDNPER